MHHSDAAFYSILIWKSNFFPYKKITMNITQNIWLYSLHFPSNLQYTKYSFETVTSQFRNNTAESGLFNEGEKSQLWRLI